MYLNASTRLKVIEGTKDSTADDFVSKGEFRMLNMFLCIYGAMYDGFARVISFLTTHARTHARTHSRTHALIPPSIDQIDGNLVGAAKGRDGDDLRIEMDEWMKGYKNVTGYGLVGLSPSLLKNDKDAKKIFNTVSRAPRALTLTLTLTLRRSSIR